MKHECPWMFEFKRGNATHCIMLTHHAGFVLAPIINAVDPDFKVQYKGNDIDDANRQNLLGRIDASAF